MITRAKVACNNSGYQVSDHFPEVRKMVSTLSENLSTPDNSIQAIEWKEITKLRDPQIKLMLDE